MLLDIRQMLMECSLLQKAEKQKQEMEHMQKDIKQYLVELERIVKDMEQLHQETIRILKDKEQMQQRLIHMLKV